MEENNINAIDDIISDADFERLIPSKDKSYFKATISFPNFLDGGKTEITGRFKIADAIAIGRCIIDGEEKELYVQFPTTSLVNKMEFAKSLKETICKKLNIVEDKEINPLDIIVTYGQFKCAETF